MHDMGIFWLRIATALYGVGLLHAMAASMRLPPFERTDDTFMAIVDRHGRQALDLGAEELLQA